MEKEELEDDEKEKRRKSTTHTVMLFHLKSSQFVHIPNQTFSIFTYENTRVRVYDLKRLYAKHFISIISYGYIVVWIELILLRLLDDF